MSSSHIPEYTVHLVAAARPNFMKIAPLYHALKKECCCSPSIIHTGQHYDHNMSESFFQDLRIPAPVHHLGIKAALHGEQTAGVLASYEQILLSDRPDCVIVVGDVNSTMACALAAVKLHIPVAHLEAGLRSFDRTMPEEINRIVTDAVSDLLWTPSEDADSNLLREGIPQERIVRVGNIMIDCFELLKEKILDVHYNETLELPDYSYGIITLHRPCNVDDSKQLRTILNALISLSETIPLVLPLHPRTSARLHEFGLMNSLESIESIIVVEPMSYIHFMSLVMKSALVITDSGGIQEESSYLGIPCFTLRKNTERPITISKGTNRLIEPESLPDVVNSIADSPRRPADIPLWDGNTAARVCKSLYSFLSSYRKGNASCVE